LPLQKPDLDGPTPPLKGISLPGPTVPRDPPPCPGFEPPGLECDSPFCTAGEDFWDWDWKDLGFWWCPVSLERCGIGIWEDGVIGDWREGLGEEVCGWRGCWKERHPPVPPVSVSVCVNSHDLFFTVDEFRHLMHNLSNVFTMSCTKSVNIEVQDPKRGFTVLKVTRKIKTGGKESVTIAAEGHWQGIEFDLEMARELHRALGILLEGGMGEL
jgi:hypothetical protein